MACCAHSVHAYSTAGGTELPEGGGALAGLDRVEIDGLDPRLAEATLVVASDVTNPLCGPRGAAATYGPQKGADADAVAELDAALAEWGRGIESVTGKLVADLPGAGAAGERRPGSSASRTPAFAAAWRSWQSSSGWRRPSRRPTS